MVSAVKNKDVTVGFVFLVSMGNRAKKRIW